MTTYQIALEKCSRHFTQIGITRKLILKAPGRQRLKKINGQTWLVDS